MNPLRQLGGVVPGGNLGHMTDFCAYSITFSLSKFNLGVVHQESGESTQGPPFILLANLYPKPKSQQVPG